MAERVTFASSTGPRLAGLVDLPDSAIRGWGVFSHGFTLGKDSPAASRICKQLASDGIGMLRFDALGLGDSEGDWGDGSFTVKVNDVVKACEFMADRGTPADILVGHSFGGAAVLAAARSSPRVRAVVTVAAPVEPSHVEAHYDAVVDRAISDGSAQWMVGGRTLTLKRAFVAPPYKRSSEVLFSEVPGSPMVRRTASPVHARCVCPWRASTTRQR
jgi:pimeloyl-ACP methyl ester carboxylesterase